MSDYQKENNELAKSFLNRTFFNCFNLKDDNNYNTLEFMINDICSQCCLYCYMDKFSQYYFPKGTRDTSTILKNAEIFINYMQENNLQVKTLELFSGDLFSQRIGFDILDLIYEKNKEKQFFNKVVIPINGTFILKEEKKNKVKKYLDKFENNMTLSLSIDGKYCQENRPMKTGQVFTDEDWNNLFKFAKEYRCGFHPMIYSNLIENWIDNFNWFQVMFKKFDIPWYNLYLLEVRNNEWTIEQTKNYQEFLKYIINWIFEKLGKKQGMNYILSSGFNFLNIFSTIGRGLGCSLQSSIHLRMGDLTIVPCHRLAYPNMEFCKFETKNDKIVNIKAINPELFISINAMDFKNNPYCQECLIKNFCAGNCLGSVYETTGDMFSIIPSVCRLYHAKIKTILEELNKHNIFIEDDFYSIIKQKNLNKVMKGLGII